MSQFDEMAKEYYRSLGKVLVTRKQAQIAEMFGSMEGIRLASAAPDLLAALESLVGDDGDLFSPTAMEQARAAMAKAKGEA